MTHLILSSLILVCAAPAWAIECTNPDTDEKFKMSMGDIKRSVKILTRELERQQIHMLDLPEKTQNDARDLDSALKEKNWCRAANMARRVEDEIYSTRVHPEFVNQKFSRIELWVRGGDWMPKIKTAAERMLALAAAKISEQDHTAANRQLNKTIQTLFSIRGLWRLPDSLPDVSDVTAGEAQVEINEADVAGGCPQLAEKGRGNLDDLKDIQRRIRRAMKKRQVRTFDIKGGNTMAANLKSYQKLRAIWPAIRVACALLHKVKTLEIGLGVTMARYHRVTKLSRQREFNDEDHKRFRELVRTTSDAIATTDYVTAHKNLEALFLLLGEPPAPQDTLRIPENGSEELSEANP